MSTSTAAGEIDAAFELFRKRWRKSLRKSQTHLSDPSLVDTLRGSYARIAVLNGWRELVIDRNVSPESAQFFLEAQNDALLSHVFASLGSWRPALQALRSCVENTMSCLYYKDHPVECAQWEAGDHRIGFKEMHAYFESHPLLKSYNGQNGPLAILHAEYATLSRAVHGSAASFRMTYEHFPTFWKQVPASLGKWASRERAALTGLNLLIAFLFRDSLAGTKNALFRAALARVIPKSHFQTLKLMGVVLK